VARPLLPRRDALADRTARTATAPDATRRLKGEARRTSEWAPRGARLAVSEEASEESAHLARALRSAAQPTTGVTSALHVDIAPHSETRVAQKASETKILKR
jgi:hypothetical protein